MFGRPQGKLDMTNVANGPVAPGLRWLGDAAPRSTRRRWGRRLRLGAAVRRMARRTASLPALSGSEPLARGLRRYRRRHRRALRGHALMIYDYAGGRRMQPPRAGCCSRPRPATRRLARTMEAFGSRRIGPARMMLTGMPRAVGA